MPKKRYYRKRQSLWAMISKMKLWPSRAGTLHGILDIDKKGDLALITTHCGEKFTARDSRNSRAARWLRSKKHAGICKNCKIPEWKISKYGDTIFSKKQGSFLKNGLI